MNKSLLYPLFVILFLGSCKAQKTERIAFYNVENLFDTINGPNNDEEFLPDGKKVDGLPPVANRRKVCELFIEI